MKSCLDVLQKYETLKNLQIHYTKQVVDVQPSLQVHVHVSISPVLQVCEEHVLSFFE